MRDTITIRLNEEEKEIIEAGASLYKGSISSVIKKIAIERFEDDFDLLAVAEYEKRKKNGTLKLHPIEELFDELGIEYDDLQS